MAQNSHSNLSLRYLQISQKVPAGVCLIAVSKYQLVDAIEALYQLGHRDFGENYAQELTEKANELNQRGCTDIRWHFIGHLQTNKTKLITPIASVIHTVDTEKLALEIRKRVRNAPLPVFIEVNIDEEISKSGVLPQDVPAFANTLYKIDGIKVEGLMCIPTANQNPRASFQRLRELELQCRPFTRGKLSMGMSDDFEIAIKEGSTHIRVGTALFGSRPTKSQAG